MANKYRTTVYRTGKSILNYLKLPYLCLFVSFYYTIKNTKNRFTHMPESGASTLLSVFIFCNLITILLALNTKLVGLNGLIIIIASFISIFIVNHYIFIKSKRYKIIIVTIDNKRKLLIRQHKMIVLIYILTSMILISFTLFFKIKENDNKLYKQKQSLYSTYKQNPPKL